MILGCVVVTKRQTHAAGLSSSSSQGWTDIDELNKDNLIACSEYANTIFDHLRESQVRFNAGQQLYRGHCSWVLCSSTQL